MAQEVIFRTWCDILVILENLMVPQMYGAVERDRRILNKRQINFGNKEGIDTQDLYKQMLTIEKKIQV